MIPDVDRCGISLGCGSLKSILGHFMHACIHKIIYIYIYLKV